MVTGLAEAYATCARLARDHYENFPVASLLLPRDMRPHVAAIYAFARAADDFADEGDRPPDVRLALLDAWRERLHACAAGCDPSDNTGLKPCADRSTIGSGAQPQSCTAACNASVATGLQSCATATADKIFFALGSTIRACRLPVSLFDDLLSAFRQDVTTVRYETWDDVLDYCRRSANPVGRLVLAVAGLRDEPIAQASDAVCTALQLTNFLQDLERDWRRGRLYLPLEDGRREGAELLDLDAGRLTPAWRNVLRGAGARTAALFDRGREVCDRAGGRLGFELRLTWLGGRRILSRLERNDFDVFRRRPALGAPELPVLLWQAMTWRAR
jgi:squalene synthase HpnC